jgi:hypothetical protein
VSQREEQVMRPSFELIEVGGFRAALEGMRFPTKSNHLSDSRFAAERAIDEAGLMLGTKDAILAAGLISQGNVHGKFQRGITAWFSINMPLSVWPELDTYTVGVDMISSESTMYTLVKEIQDINRDRFTDETSDEVIEFFKQEVNRLTSKYGDRKSIPIDVLKAALPCGWLQRRNRGFSYQVLANMYRYRKDHRMYQWRDIICKEIENLPYLKELILGEV